MLAEIATTFAQEWAAEATPEEMLALIEKAPEIPKDLYVQLLLKAEATVGSLRTHGEAKGQLRRSFFKALKAARRA